MNKHNIIRNLGKTLKNKAMNKQEGNKLIAVFMDLVYRHERNYTGWTEKFAYRQCDDDGLTFDSSWNSLMPVYHKIQDVELPQADLVFKEFFNTEIVFNNINFLFQACVGFIEWYNKATLPITIGTVLIAKSTCEIAGLPSLIIGKEYPVHYIINNTDLVVESETAKNHLFDLRQSEEHYWGLYFDLKK